MTYIAPADNDAAFNAVNVNTNVLTRHHLFLALWTCKHVHTLVEKESLARLSVEVLANQITLVTEVHTAVLARKDLLLGCIGLLTLAGMAAVSCTSGTRLPLRVRLV